MSSVLLAFILRSGEWEKKWHILFVTFRFRTCLQMANTEFADTVGNVFFNVIRTQCFTHSMEDVCLERTWWGKCNKREVRRTAAFRDVIPYTNNRLNRFWDVISALILLQYFLCYLELRAWCLMDTHIFTIYVCYIKRLNKVLILNLSTYLNIFGLTFCHT